MSFFRSPRYPLLIVSLLLLLLGNSALALQAAPATRGFAAQATPTPSPSKLRINTRTTAAAEDAVGRLQDVRQAVIQIVGKGTFRSPDEGLQYNVAGSGSGFIIDPSGIAVTNNHVVTGAALLQVYIAGEDEPRNARVLGVSECSDLAVIDIEGDGFPYLTWYEGELEPGLTVYSAGFPLGDPEYTLTDGIIAKARADGDTNWASVAHVVEHTASIKPGNSGGPLISAEGQIVAVNYAGSDENDQFYAIAGDIAQPIIATLRQGSDQDSVGLNGEVIFNNEGESMGIWINSVQSGSPADATGIRPGDLLITMEGIIVAEDGTLSTYCDILRSHDADDVMAVQIYRNDTKELLEGQLNGRTLTLSSIIGGGAEDEEQGNSQVDDDSGESYEDFSEVANSDETLVMEVPTTWTDTEERAWEVNDEPVGPRLIAAPDVEDFLNAWDTPGVILSVSDVIVADYEIEEFLDSFDYSEACEKEGRYEMPEGYYAGAYDIWENCGDAESSNYIVVLIPEEGNFVAQIEATVVTDADLDALNHVIDTFVYVGADDDAGQQSGDQYEYAEIDEEALSGLLPESWAIETGVWETDDGEELGVTLTAAGDIEAFNDTWAEAGVYVRTASGLTEALDPLELLDEADFSDDCTRDDRVPHEHTANDIKYVGAYDLWTSCGDEENVLAYVVVVSEPVGQLVLMSFVAISDADAEAFGALLNSFFVEGGLSEEDPEEELDIALAEVQSDTLNVRAGPGTNYNRIGSVNQGDILGVVGQVNNCAWLSVVTLDGTEGWVSGAAQYISLDTPCAQIPRAQAPQPPANSGNTGGGGSQGCVLFRNNLGAELTITFTRPSDNWNKTFKVAGNRQHRECFAPARYTLTVDAPPPWGSFNDELTISAGDNFPYDVNPAQ
jgi:serine protease Do